MNNDSDELTKQIMIKAYAMFCVEHKMQPSKLAAENFAVQVTESGAKQYHGMTSDALVQMLCADLPESG